MWIYIVDNYKKCMELIKNRNKASQHMTELNSFKGALCDGGGGRS